MLSLLFTLLLLCTNYIPDKKFLSEIYSVFVIGTIISLESALKIPTIIHFTFLVFYKIINNFNEIC